eukprot:15479580-Alexandrium_andersonii.AAC.1
MDPLHRGSPRPLRAAAHGAPHSLRASGRIRKPWGAAAGGPRRSSRRRRPRSASSARGRSP